MKRRGFIILLGGAALAWPLAGHAQQTERMRRIGALYFFAQNDTIDQSFVTAFTQALERLGWRDGHNIRIDNRFAAGNLALFKQYAAELVNLAPDAILAATPPAVAALREQTRTIPIVSLLGDPVELGFVQSLAHPGGNITGFSAYDAPMMGKWLQLLKEVAPGVTRVAVIFNPDTAPHAPLFNRAIQAAARSLGITVTLAPVHDDAGIEETIAAQAREPGGGLISLPDSFISAHSDVIIAAATRHRLPLMGQGAPWTRAGALMSYSFDTVDLFARAASYIDRILRGASPADLPVQQPTKFSLIINLKAAKALGLTIPPALLAEADELID
jgi:putative tryptophan/tyrosine transport system substrate-binding protein